MDAKDYFRLEDKRRETVLAHAVKKPVFVPENMKADMLLRKMRKSGFYFAVEDEYGGMSGIVTVRDLIELPEDGASFELETEQLIISVGGVEDRRIREALVSRKAVEITDDPE